jgi:hypothetical protein
LQQRHGQDNTLRVSQLHPCTIQQASGILFRKNPGIQDCDRCHAKDEQGPSEQTIESSRGKECQRITWFIVLVFEIVTSTDAYWLGDIFA